MPALSNIVFTLNIVLSLFLLCYWAFIIDSKPSMKDMKMIGYVDDIWLMTLSPDFTYADFKHILVPFFCCLFIACRNLLFPLLDVLLYFLAGSIDAYFGTFFLSFHTWCPNYSNHFVSTLCYSLFCIRNSVFLFIVKQIIPVTINTE